MGTRNNYNVMQNAYAPTYPKQPRIEACKMYHTLAGEDVKWTSIDYRPTVKKLYTGVPNYYPPQKISRPHDTLYGHDFSMYHDSGVGKGKRITYHRKMWPLTDINVRERKKYADYVLPYMDATSMTKYPIRTDTSLNNPLQVEPKAYTPY